MTNTAINFAGAENILRSMEKDTILEKATAVFCGAKHLAKIPMGEKSNYIMQAWNDLVIRFGIDMGDIDEGNIAYAYPTKQFLDCAGVSEEEFKEAAYNNIKGKQYVSTLGGVMVDILENMDEAEKDAWMENLGDELHEDYPIVLTNVSKYGGAIHVIDKGILKTLSLLARGDDLYILPSSIHEVLIFPASTIPSDVTELLAMVREINSFAVSEKDFMSDNIYKYISATGEWEIIS